MSDGMDKRGDMAGGLHGCDDMCECRLCPRNCSIPEGGLGFCGARTCVDGNVISHNYGYMTGIALDPIEKKPLSHFHPGSLVLSVGSYGCNLSCPFCQNSSISMIRGAAGRDISRFVGVDDLVALAKKYESRGNIGVAYTYNEPGVGYEYLMDAMPAIHESGMLNVMVTNGYMNAEPLRKMVPYVDAANIDIKAFTQDFYDKVGAPKGLDTLKEAVEIYADSCHVEITTLVIPGWNDSEDEMDGEARWIASVDSEIPLHITRFFPRYKLLDILPTPIKTMKKLEKVARRYLENVELGNV